MSEFPLTFIRHRVSAVLPLGDGVVAFYPHQTFRLDLIQLPVLPDVVLRLGGRSLPCEGQTHQVESPDRCVCVGAFLAFHFHNGGVEPVPVEFEVEGLCAKGSSPDGVAVVGELVESIAEREVQLSAPAPSAPEGLSDAELRAEGIEPDVTKWRNVSGVPLVPTEQEAAELAASSAGTLPPPTAGNEAVASPVAAPPAETPPPPPNATEGH